ncbi:MAG: porin [Chitinophagaceae bacterium]
MLYLLRTKAVRPVVFFLSFFIVVHAKAQYRELNQEDHDAKSYYFGITLGTNLSKFNAEMHPYFLEQDTIYTAEPLNSGGFQLGLLATIRLNNRFEFRFNPLLMFTERNLQYRLKYKDPIDGFDVTKKVESVIVSFPFQVKFNSDRIGNFRVYMLGGVKADIDLASNATARKADDMVKIGRYDFGVETGVGFNFYYPSFILSPEIKISNGFNNLHARDANLKYSNVFDRMQSRMIVFSIHLEG